MARHLDRIAEMRIRAAQRRGELDNLPGEGKPLPRDHLAGLSQEERVEALAMRSCGAPPEEVVLLKRIEELEEALADETDEERRSALRHELGQSAFRLHVLAIRGRRPLLAARIAHLLP